MYLTSSRPDIVQAVCYCARYQARPTEKHLKEVKRIFRYLRGTINMGLWYPKGSGFDLTAFSDADHAGCIDTRKSTSGGIQFLGDKLVSWMSKKQDCTAMSSAEAEYVALSASCAQVMWMRTQLQDYGFNYNKIPLYYDSQSATTISCNSVQHSRTKHIHTRYHFIKEQVENGIIELYFIRIEYQLADMFTKALNEDRSYALSWKPYQGDSLNLPDHRYSIYTVKQSYRTEDGDGDASFQLRSDSLPHAHAQTTKTYYMHQDSRIMKAQELNTKTSAQTLIYKIFLQRYQVYQGILLESFQNDAKYEHVGQDTRSQGKANAIAFDEIDKAPEEKKRGIIIAATKGTWHIARNKKKAIHILRGTKYQENFNVVLGKGEFGTVYHGYIDDTQVAVKILSESSLQGDKEFMAEKMELHYFEYKGLDQKTYNQFKLNLLLHVRTRATATYYIKIWLAHVLRYSRLYVHQIFWNGYLDIKLKMMIIEFLIDRFPNGEVNDQAIGELKVLYEESKKRFVEDAKFKDRTQLMQDWDERHKITWEKIYKISREHYQKVYQSLGARMKEKGERLHDFYISHALDLLRGKGFNTNSEGDKAIVIE
ncbi:retrovirus-related pol polyprotein from transposon TNT 1-94 [Tanacetum coccineum]|uniref:Retrovirus-related pol polyprotein from transposon TNT 1-94 n=1 Tax=Tanacetum coccineum TaxID=301880 RepID=A0ABQ5B0H3_9ASTR